ncbi:MAG: cadmium-translocating P-type ATPase [Candidatus Tectomicrobia bacterium]|nr:cadmium-translocating P-type ATPase [Candidatus Tectomicrobia bacterium]
MDESPGRKTADSPDPGDTCIDALSDALRDAAGVVSAEIDGAAGLLTLRYSPSQASGDRVLLIACRTAGRLGRHFVRCFHRVTEADCRACVSGAGAGPGGDPALAVRLEGRTLEVTRAQGAAWRDAGRAGILETITRPIEAPPAPRAGAAGAAEEDRERSRMAVLTLLCAASLAAGWGVGWFPSAPPWAQRLLYGLAYVFGGYYAARSAWGVIRNFSIDVSGLMILAALGAAAIGHWGEGAVLMFLFSLSTTLESVAMGKTRRAIRSLMDLRPADALVLRGGREVRLPVEELEVGDRVRVKPGERVPADGVVLSGESSVDQSPITGESIPVEKGPGDPVFAGTVNDSGVLEVEVTRRAEDTALARMLHLVEEARSARASSQRLTDWFGRYYSAGVIGGTAAVALLPPIFFDISFSSMFYRAMTFLVAASPCAVVISIPASILSAIANAAGMGVLFKGGIHLEDLAKVRAVMFDKTGTLTAGDPRVTDVLPRGAVPEEEVLRIAASVEKYSDHPLAAAVVAAASARRLTLEPTSTLQTLRGRGVKATFGDRRVLVGNERLCREAGMPVPEDLLDRMKTLERQGKTTMLVASDTFLGVIAVADSPRPAARSAIEDLKRLGVERVVMLTGDNARSARSAGEALGVDEVRAELLPEQKVEAVRDAQRRYGGVAMVGDGVNDAPAMASSTVGIAMGAAGTDAALETADVILMGDDLRKIPFAVSLSRQAHRVIQQNLTLSLGVMTLLALFSLFGWVPLPLAVVGHEGSTLVVVANGLRLLRCGRTKGDGPPRGGSSPAPERRVETGR